MYFAVLSKGKVKTVIIMAIVMLITCLGVYFSGAQQVFFGYAVKKLPIYRVQTESKKVAISFDCAWGVDYTDKLLDIMAEHGVKCTFFTVEFWAKKYPEYVKKISEHGHEIGTHSATHPHMSKLDKNAMVKELTTSKKVIEEITGKKVELFRPPFGEYNDLLIDVAEELELYTIQWDVDSLDWKDLSSAQIEKRVTERVKNGSIVLFHNQGLHTTEALEGIITTLKNKGYEFVSIGELIYRDNYHVAPDGAQVKNS